jgi:hypothetical protein
MRVSLLASLLNLLLAFSLDLLLACLFDLRAKRRPVATALLDVLCRPAGQHV